MIATEVKTPKIVIEVEDGCVSGIWISHEIGDVELTIFDHDAQECEDDIERAKQEQMFEDETKDLHQIN